MWADMLESVMDDCGDMLMKACGNVASSPACLVISSGVPTCDSTHTFLCLRCLFSIFYA